MIDGVIVARFQFAVLPEPIRHALDKVTAAHKELLIVLGEAAIPGSRNNPLSVAARASAIHAVYPSVKVLHLRDHPNNAVWSQNLDRLLLDAGVAKSAVIYGNRARFSSLYAGEFRTSPLPEVEGLRVELSVQEKPESMEFRMGRVHAFQTSYPKVFPTVDIALFRSGRSELLLGKKDLDGLWRLPGGFVDPDDESYEAAAKRELTEETGPVVTSRLQFERSFKVDDWRYRNEVDKIITSLFAADYLEGDPVGSDDLAEVRWFPMHQVKRMLDEGETVSEHAPMLKYLLEKYI